MITDQLFLSFVVAVTLPNGELMVSKNAKEVSFEVQEINWLWKFITFFWSKGYPISVQSH